MSILGLSTAKMAHYSNYIKSTLNQYNVCAGAILNTFVNIWIKRIVMKFDAALIRYLQSGALFCSYFHPDYDSIEMHHIRHI